MIAPSLPRDPRFWSKVDIRGADECWEWKASKARGYGSYRIGAKKFPASRVALEMRLHRPLRSDEYACHTCDNKACVNPAHLYAGSAADNSRDARERGRFNPAKSRAKLTVDDVEHVRRMLREGVEPWRIGMKFGVTEHAIRNIRAGRSWAEQNRGGT